MNRLKHTLLALPEKTETFGPIYEGTLRVRPAECFGKDCTGCRSDPCHVFTDDEPTYYHDGVGYTLSATHKLAKDRPTVVIAIPADRLLGHPAADSPAAHLAAEIAAAEAAAKKRREANLPITETHLATPRVVAAADHALRALGPVIDALNAPLYNRKRTDAENGKYVLDEPGSIVCLRNSAYFAFAQPKWYQNLTGTNVQELSDMPPPAVCLCIRMQVQLPFHKLRQSVRMLCRDLPYAVSAWLADFDRAALGKALALSETQQKIRAWLAQSDCCAFLADGSILPRQSGTERPMADALPFVSTPADAVTVAGVRGMGIRRGVTVITGGGYSGKSTVLDAISAGVYDHVLSDGRELCLTDPSGVTIAAEDGRSVKNLNISPFLKWLPTGDARDFSTAHASGSTSQAANIMEALDANSTLLLIDEDKSATNFMIRDDRMKALIAREPITPFTDRVRELAARGVSTILVIGGSGEYLAVADRVYRMDEFVIRDVTAEAHDLCGGLSIPEPPPADWSQHRCLRAEGFTSFPEGASSEVLAVDPLGFLRIGDEAVDLRGMSGLALPAQTEALAFFLRALMRQNPNAEIDLANAVDALLARIAREGLDTVWSSYFTTCGRFLALPRRQEVFAAVARMRHVQFAPTVSGEKTAEEARAKRLARWMRGETV